MAAKTYSASQLAKLAGVSVRTLHWYEEQGLLVPARKPNGYRAYGPRDVVRLQQILLYRACGMGLSQIGEVLGVEGYDAHEALEQHRQALLARKEQIEQLIATVEKTIAAMEGEVEMTDAERFEGLKAAAIEANERTYGAEARERYGDDVMDAANAKLLAMDETEWNDLAALEQAIIEQLVAAMATGDAQGAEAQKLAAMHERWIRMQWPEGAYSRAAHKALAQGYTADARFTEYYDSRAGEGATAFLADAIAQL